jgi:hypothetical protein
VRETAARTSEELMAAAVAAAEAPGGGPTGTGVALTPGCQIVYVVHVSGLGFRV